MAVTKETYSRFKKWYINVIGNGDDEFLKFEYHLKSQFGEISLEEKQVLEVGCGLGAVSLYLALFSGAKEVTAVDEAAGKGSAPGVTQVLDDARKEFEVNNLRIINIDIMKNFFEDNSFDLVIANNALHHVVGSGVIRKSKQLRAEYVCMINELGRILKPNGYLSVEEFSRCSIWRWSPIKFKWNKIDWNMHPTRTEWVEVIFEAGLEIKSCKYEVPYALRYFKPILSNDYAQFLSYPHFFITAQKG